MFRTPSSLQACASLLRSAYPSGAGIQFGGSDVQIPDFGNDANGMREHACYNT
jgi:hypothetical protein